MARNDMARNDMELPTATTALVTMECQRGVVGDLATFPELASAVASTSMTANLNELCLGMRSRGCEVVHAMAHFRADRRGSMKNAPLLRAAARIDGQLLEGSPAAELIGEVEAQPSDLRSIRLHGVSPFTGTDLDAALRSLGTRTIVAAGASLNVGLMGLSIEAVNLGYRVVLASDACVSVPHDAAGMLIDSSYSQLARVLTVSEVLAALV